MKLTLNQGSEYLNKRKFKYKGRSITYRTMRTMNESGMLKTEKVYLGEHRYIYMCDSKFLDMMVSKNVGGE